MLYSFGCSVGINMHLGTKIWEMKLIFQEKKTLCLPSVNTENVTTGLCIPDPPVFLVLEKQ